MSYTYLKNKRDREERLQQARDEAAKKQRRAEVDRNYANTNTFRVSKNAMDSNIIQNAAQGIRNTTGTKMEMTSKAPSYDAKQDRKGEGDTTLTSPSPWSESTQRKMFRNKDPKDYYGNNFMSGLMDGFTGTLLPVDENVDDLYLPTYDQDLREEYRKAREEQKDSTSYKVGNFGGSIGAYLVGSAAMAPLAGKVAAKVAPKVGSKVLGKVATKATESFVRDIPSGAVLTNNQLIGQGIEIGSDEWEKQMLQGIALDMGANALLDVALPGAIKAVKGRKAAKLPTKSDEVIDAVKAEAKAEPKVVKAEPKVEAVKTEPVRNQIVQENPNRPFTDEEAKRLSKGYVSDTDVGIDDGFYLDNQTVGNARKQRELNKELSEYTRSIQSGGSPMTKEQRIAQETEMKKLVEYLNNGDFEAARRQSLRMADIVEDIDTDIYFPPYGLDEDGISTIKSTLNNRDFYVGDKNYIRELQKDAVGTGGTFRTTRQKIVKTRPGQLGTRYRGADQIDQVYAELSELYPFVFPEDIITEEDQIIRMMEVKEKLNSTPKGIPLDYPIEAMKEGYAKDLMRIAEKYVDPSKKAGISEAVAKVSAEEADIYAPIRRVEVGEPGTISNNDVLFDNLPERSTRELPKGDSFAENPLKDKQLAEAAKQNGTYKNGIPVKNLEGESITQSVDSMQRSSWLSDKTKKQAAYDAMDGMLTKQSHGKYADIIEECSKRVNSVEDARRVADVLIRRDDELSRVWSLEDAAEARKAIEILQDSGEQNLASALFNEYTVQMSENANRMAFAKAFYANTPMGRVSVVEKLAKKLGKENGVEIALPDDLMEQLAKATDKSEIGRINDKISTAIWSQIPPSFTEKVNAIRYLSMLSSPKTHIRNVVGNMVMYPLRRGRDSIGSQLEKFLPKELRTKSFVTRANPSDRALIDIGAKEYKAIQDSLMHESKFVASSRPMGSRVFSDTWYGNMIQKASDFNSNMLNLEDMWFSSPAYSESFASFAKARGYTAETILKNPQVYQEANEYALRQSLESTFRNNNAVSDWLGNMQKYSNTAWKNVPGTTSEKLLKKGGSMFANAAVPFVKTPTNIAKTAIDYSPAGILEGFVDLAKYAKSGDQQLVTLGLERLSSGLIGTGVFGLGAYGCANGFLTPSIDATTPEGAYEKMKGRQEYSMTIGDTNITLDWLAPTAIPLFAGAEWYNAVHNDKGITLSQALNAIGNVSDPMFEMSMLSGVENIFDTSFGDGAKIPQIAQNAAQTYLSQYLPSIGSQFNKVISPYQMSAVTTSDTPTGRSWDRWLKQQANKIPLLGLMVNEPYVDQMGQYAKEKTSPLDYLASAGENFLSPGNIRTIQSNDTTNELDRLLRATDGDSASQILPKSTSQYNITWNGDSYRMSPSELTQFKLDRGQSQKNGLDQLFKSDEYQRMTDAEKVDAIRRVYDDSFSNAKNQYLMNSQGVSLSDIQFSNLSPSAQAKYDPKYSKDEFITAYNALGGESSKSGMAMRAAENGVSYDMLSSMSDIDQNYYGASVYLTQEGITADDLDYIVTIADDGGNQNGRLNKAELQGALDAMGYTREQKRAMWYLLGSKVGNAKNPY